MKKYGILLCLVFAVGVVIVTNEPPQIPRDSSAPRPAVTQKSPPLSSEDRSSQPPTKAPSREIAELAPLLNAPIAMRASGVPQKFELATDELYLRLPDGSQRVLAIPKATTPETFAAAIEKARAEHGIEPELVLYPLGAPRNEYSRRIVTRDVVVKAASKSEADAVATAGGLVFQKALDFAPDAFVYKAPTSLQALTAQLDAEAVNLAAVSTQLAKKAAKMSMPNDPYVQLQWHLKNTGQRLREPGGVDITATPRIDINVESVWNYPEPNSASYDRGQGVVIGIVDDGLQWNHPDLQANVIRDLQWDWIQSDNDPSPYYYNDAHGTACAGVAAARGNNRLGVSGVAPEASLVGMRLISVYDHVTDLDEAEAMAWKSDQIDIKSNSWGYPSVVDGSISDPYDPVVDDPDGEYYLRKNDELANAAIKHAIAHGRGGKGTIFTFAAGNSFYYTTYDVTDPDKPIIQVSESGARVEFADYQGSMYTIAVGAIDSSGKKSWYSQIGSALVVSAPSNGEIGIMTTDVTGYYGYVTHGGHWDGTDIRGSGDYSKTFGGTSSACPTVSGVIALMLQKNPDLGWRDVQEILIRSANNTFDAAGWETNGAGIKFNYDYGAGMVDAAAAVEMAEGWTNLVAQTHSVAVVASEDDINPGSTMSRTFPITGALRVEHVLLKLSTPDVKKGDLKITLTSPSGMESIFCEPHDDDVNELEEWTFMSVRHWGEDSDGTWTLTIENTGGDTGTLTDTELIIYGTQDPSENPGPTVTLVASRASVFVGSTITLTASAIDKKADGSTGEVDTLELLVDGVASGPVSADGAWLVTANKEGNYTLAVQAKDSEGKTAVSEPVTLNVVPRPIAAWDFDTAENSPIPLATAVQSTRKYVANFGNGTLTFDGSFDGEAEGSNKWEFGEGQIFRTDGSAVNAVAEMDVGYDNKALLLRGGKDLASEGKAIVFEFDMTGRGDLYVSYAGRSRLNGFTSHVWSYSSNGTDWTPIQTITPTLGYTAWALDPIVGLKGIAYLRVELSGITAVNGENAIDNVILSASLINPEKVEDPLEVVPTTNTIDRGAAPPAPEEIVGGEADSSPTDSGSIGLSHSEQILDWVAPEGGAYSMFVYAEVVEGAEYLNAPGNILSATKNNNVVGLAEPVPQSTRYDLAISSPEKRTAPLLMRLYDFGRQSILVMEEELEFESGTTLGSPSMPVRYNVAYEEVEQRISVVQGWNSFTTAVDPDPSKLSAILSDYSAAEGDHLVGPTSEATYRDGAWEPEEFELVGGADYALLRQAASPATITLLGKELKGDEKSASTKQSDSATPSAQQSKLATTAPTASSQSGHTSHSPAPTDQAESKKSKSEKKSKSSKKSKSEKKFKKSKKSKKGKAKRGKKSRTN